MSTFQQTNIQGITCSLPTLRLTIRVECILLWYDVRRSGNNPAFMGPKINLKFFSNKMPNEICDNTKIVGHKNSSIDFLRYCVGC